MSPPNDERGFSHRLKALHARLGRPGASDTPPWRNGFFALIAILLLGVAFSLLRSPAPQSLSYTELKDAVRNDRIAQLTFEGEQVRGRFLAEPASAGSNDQGRPLGGHFTSTLPQLQDPALLGLLEQHHVEIDAESAETGLLSRMLITLLPWVLILGGFLYLSGRMQKRMMGGGDQGQGGGPFGIGKSRAKRVQAKEVDTRFAQVAGLDNAKTDLHEIVAHLSEPGRFRALGARLPKGVMLVGPPGTGKTLLARAVAGEAGVPFFSISGSEFVEMFVGVGASRVRDLFKDAKAQSPCVIFIDEIDAIGRSRGAGLVSGGGGNEEREQTLNQILKEMDGFSPREDVVVLAATNRPDVLDQALLRPGRFDRKVYLERPDREARAAILRIHAEKIALAEEVDLTRVAERTVGFSGADLANLVNEAALLAGRARQDQVRMDDFTQARDKIALGAERERGTGEDERQLVAYHECGHALLAWLLPHADPLDKVSIIPRGRALGATEQIPPEERQTYRQGYLRDRIGVMLGGRIAEQTVFGEVTTGAEADLEQATKLARRMVGRWGMSEAIGPVSFKQADDQEAGSPMMGASPRVSEATAHRIDAEIKALLESIEREAQRLIELNREHLERLAKELLEAETLHREQIDAILDPAH